MAADNARKRFHLVRNLILHKWFAEGSFHQLQFKVISIRYAVNLFRTGAVSAQPATNLL
jgi:hypothetical protein